jgi:23S rRNA (guanosine2251-2'-O)-methyltransferase
VALELRNPHSVLAALDTRPGAVVEVRLHSRQPPAAWEQVAERAAAARVPVRRGMPAREHGRSGRRSGGHGGSESERAGAGVAIVKERDPVDLPELFADAKQRSGGRGLWLALDQIQDPRNVGAIFRSAAFFGAEGVVLTRNKSAPLSGVAYDAASGGLEHVPFAQPPNLSRALQVARDSGLWILGASEHAERDVAEMDRGRPWLLVLGNEQQGLRRLTREGCDAMCRLSPRGPVQSLNVSVAAAVLMSALTR